MKNLNLHYFTKTENNQTQKLGEKKMKAQKLILGLVALSVLWFAASATAGVPQMINYQGVLTDSVGCPVDDGEYDMVFRIYNVATGGDSLWGESHSSVDVTQGNFNVSLGGSGSPIPDSIFLNDSLWLEVEVEDEKMDPRQRIASVGYAFRSGFADTAEYAPPDDDWTPDTSGFNIYRLTGNVGIGTPSPQYKLDVADTAQIIGFKMPTGASDGYVLTSDASGVGTWQAAAGEIGGSGTANYVSKFVDTTTLDNSVIYEDGGNIGIGTDDPDAKLDAEATGGTAVKGVSEGDAGGKFGGEFLANGAGYSNVGVWARAGCYSYPCTPASYCNIGIYAKDGSGGSMDMLPSGNWAGYFKGDVKVTDSLDVGGSATIDDDLSVGGTIKLTFDYESAWTGISPGGCVTLTHNLGGDPSKYVVYLYGKSTDGGIHQTNYGMDCAKYVVIKCFGAWWRSLTSTQITVCRASDDDEVGSSGDWYRAKVRILKNQ